MRSQKLALLLATSMALAAWLLYSLSAANASGVHYVATSCDGVPSPCYITVQAAVDAAEPGDEILVATGIYTGISFHNPISSVVYISKTVTIQDGYTITNWTMPYPITQPTTLHAQGHGRVVCIVSNANPTIEGLHITGGDAEDGNGGGVFAEGDVIFRNNLVFCNKAGNGGGMYLGGDLQLSGNTIVSNAAKLGGGLYFNDSTAILDGNIITGNVATNGGAGVVLSKSDAVFTNTVITDNTSGLGLGTGLHISLSSVTCYTPLSPET